MKEKPNVVSQPSGAFHSYRTPKATKNVNAGLFIQSSNSYKLDQGIPGNF